MAGIFSKKSFEWSWCWFGAHWFEHRGSPLVILASWDNPPNSKSMGPNSEALSRMTPSTILPEKSWFWWDVWGFHKLFVNLTYGLSRNGSVFWQWKHLNIFINNWAMEKTQAFDKVSKQWKKPWVFRLYRELCYPVIWGLQHAITRIPIKQPVQWKVRGFFSWLNCLQRLAVFVFSKFAQLWFHWKLLGCAGAEAVWQPAVDRKPSTPWGGAGSRRVVVEGWEVGLVN